MRRKKSSRLNGFISGSIDTTALRLSAELCVFADVGEDASSRFSRIQIRRRSTKNYKSRGSAIPTEIEQGGFRRSLSFRLSSSADASMAGSDASIYLSAVRWGDEGISFQDFLRRFPQPQVARVIRGQHGHVGVPSLASPGLNSIVFLARGGPRLRVTAQCVKFKENRRVVTVGPRLGIAGNFRGWFEILSEDGRASRCYESVAELLRRLPDTCLVREPVKAHLAHPEKPETVTDKTRTLPQGETLVLVREVRASLGRLRPTPGRFLRCLTSSGDTVYLAAEVRGKFSPLAKEGNISGVHTVKTLLSKRFPLMVRLVHSKQTTGLKTTEMRLLSVEKEECVMALPLMKDAPPVMLSPSATLKLQVPKNGDVLQKLPEYLRLTQRCEGLMEQATDIIDILDSHPKDAPRVPPHRSMSEPNAKCRPETIERGMSEPAPDDDRYEEIDQIYDYVRGFAPLPDKIKVELQQQTNGVDVSKAPHQEPPRGEKPLPPPIETIPARRFSLATDPGVGPTSPPPIVLKAARVRDTESHIYEAVIRRVEDRSKLNRIPAKIPQKPPNNKLFVKSSHPMRNGKPRLLRQIRPPVLLKDGPPVPVVIPQQKSSVRTKISRCSKSTVTTSPLFNIRYKSMTNLAVEFNDTLDSSNSGGGRTSSGGSGGSKGSRDRNGNVPQKLSRPKSLSNLFWDVEANNKYNLMHSEMKTNQCIYVADVPAKVIARPPGSKRVGTLYL
ncbi:uncharacterized protein LOC135399099 isoform X3 [Ornithodoros turicata]|uniref:uncharacterized protein LOC135399099 isoform X3 n=1 Tax=Ornithodoros turicata TaxID=34597 RepID=UPI0031390EAA